MSIAHDRDCPAAESWSTFDCTCNPDISIQSEENMLRQVKQDRQAPRRAQREAAKVIQKAKAKKC